MDILLSVSGQLIAFLPEGRHPQFMTPRTVHGEAVSIYQSDVGLIRWTKPRTLTNHFQCRYANADVAGFTPKVTTLLTISIFLFGQ